MPSGLSRPRRLRGVVPVPPPPRVVKSPATKILPFACTARARTGRFAPGSKPVSTVPSRFNRPILLRAVVPPLPRVVKDPPATIFPSACTARACTVLFAPGLKLFSSVPSGLSRPTRLRAVCPIPPPPRVVKSPPSNIFPSGCSATARTLLFAPGSKSLSSVPSA